MFQNLIFKNCKFLERVCSWFFELCRKKEVDKLPKEQKTMIHHTLRFVFIFWVHSMIFIHCTNSHSFNLRAAQWCASGNFACFLAKAELWNLVHTSTSLENTVSAQHFASLNSFISYYTNRRLKNRLTDPFFVSSVANVSDRKPSKHLHFSDYIEKSTQRLHLAKTENSTCLCFSPSGLSSLISSSAMVILSGSLSLTAVRVFHLI